MLVEITSFEDYFDLPKSELPRYQMFAQLLGGRGDAGEELGLATGLVGQLVANTREQHGHGSSHVDKATPLRDKAVQLPVFEQSTAEADDATGSTPQGAAQRFRLSGAKLGEPALEQELRARSTCSGLGGTGDVVEWQPGSPANGSGDLGDSRSRVTDQREGKLE